jgi:hypothetical protein
MLGCAVRACAGSVTVTFWTRAVCLLHCLAAFSIVGGQVFNCTAAAECTRHNWMRSNHVIPAG